MLLLLPGSFRPEAVNQPESVSLAACRINSDNKITAAPRSRFQTKQNPVFKYRTQNVRHQKTKVCSPDTSCYWSIPLYNQAGFLTPDPRRFPPSHANAQWHTGKQLPVTVTSSSGLFTRFPLRMNTDFHPSPDSELLFIIFVFTIT